MILLPAGKVVKLLSISRQMLNDNNMNLRVHLTRGGQRRYELEEVMRLKKVLEEVRDMTDS